MKQLLAGILSCCILLGLCGCSVAQLRPDDTMLVVYTNVHTGVSFQDQLTEQEKANVLNTLGGKPLEFAIFQGTPGCGFDPSVAIVIQDVPYALALDKCGILQNCKTGQYIYITDHERAVLEAIFIARGGTFPCN